MIIHEIDGRTTRKILSVYDKAFDAKEQLGITDETAFIKGIGEGIWTVALQNTRENRQTEAALVAEMLKSEANTSPDYAKGILLGMMAITGELKAIKAIHVVQPKTEAANV